MSLSRLTLRTRHLTISIDAPSGIVERLHTLRRTAAIAASRPKGPLAIASHSQALHVETRDAMAAVEVYRDMRGRPAQTGQSSATDDLERRVEEVFWYHTIELPGNIVTPGTYDHRPLVPHYGIPNDLRGKRVLDVATFDGFWAFEFERRGANVVAADVGRFSQIDFPPPIRDALVREGLDRQTGLGFQIAHEALKSHVQRVERSVYDLDPTEMGTFDLVHVADLLLHLENPLRALRAIRQVTHGSALIADCFDPRLSGDVTRYLGGWANVPWWLPSLDTLAQMIVDAGFSDVQLRMVYTLGEGGRSGGHHRASLVATA